MGFAYASLPPITSGGQDGQGDFSTPGPTWHYRHVALCLNERKTLLGIATALSALPTEIRDDAIAYTEINLARAMIKSMCVNTAFKKTYDKFITTASSVTAAGNFASISDLLSYCGLTQSSWMNVLYGVVQYQENMQAGSTLVLKCIRELQLAVSKMINIRITHDVFSINKNDGNSTGSSSWSTEFAAAKNETSNPNIDNKFEFSIKSAKAGSTYYCQINAPSSGQMPKTITYSSLLTLSHKLTVPIYLQTRTGTYSPNYEFDFLGLGQDASTGNKWIALYVGTESQNATENVSINLPDRTGLIQSPAPTLSSYDNRRIHASTAFEAEGLIAYTFTNDAQLYKNSY